MQTTHLTDTMQQIEHIISEDAIHDSSRKCIRGSRKKGTVSKYWNHWPEEDGKLAKELQDGTYREGQPRFFTIEEPKHREIMSIRFRDRVYQRSLNDNAIYPQITRSLIYDNFACQKGKGTDSCRERFRDFLREAYRHHGTDACVLRVDVKGYYPNMDHEEARKILRKLLDDETYQLADKAIDFFQGDKGFNPGSQLIQNVGIAILSPLDHYIKERLRVRWYLRYMDDLNLIGTREEMEHALAAIKAKLAEIGFEVNRKKTKIYRITDKILFMGFVYRVTDTGKVVILADPKKIKHEKKKIRHMIALVKKGEKNKREVDQHFKRWKVCIRFGNSHKTIERLNRWYEKEWEDYYK